MFHYYVFPFAYNYLYILFKSIILFVCLNRFFISLVAMEPSCKTYVETDMVSLHYVTFIEPLAICLTEALSFDSDQFTKNSINKVIEEKTNDPFLLLQEHLSTAFFVYKKLMNYNSMICRMKFSSSSQNHKVSAKIFVNHKFYHNNFILTTKNVYTQCYIEQKLFIPQHHTRLSTSYTYLPFHPTRSHPLTIAACKKACHSRPTWILIG
jgi:hypothetical protein